MGSKTFGVWKKTPVLEKNTGVRKKNTSADKTPVLEKTPARCEKTPVLNGSNKMGSKKIESKIFGVRKHLGSIIFGV